MALVPSTPSEAIWVTQQSTAGLDSDGNVIPKDGYEAVERPNMTEQEKRAAFADTFSTEYNSYALAGVVLGAADGTEDPSIIENYLLNISLTTPTDMGQMLANYWATVKLNYGTAQQLDVVIDVVNDAASLAPDFTAAVQSSITTSLGTKPFYIPLISNVEAVAKTIKWTITEQNTSTGATTTYVSNIS